MPQSILKKGPQQIQAALENYSQDWTTPKNPSSTLASSSHPRFPSAFSRALTKLIPSYCRVGDLTALLPPKVHMDECSLELPFLHCLLRVRSTGFLLQPP